ncbi:DUF1016 N-terminal domain-containing protein [Achromobacter aloeverae]|uniref:hypothetical protein n=1 Tax=Achromobacter aloeverae TaxID=1750518 RepID=UPI0036119CF4
MRAAFPDMKGFSPRNIKYMRALAEAWPDESIVQRCLHNCRGIPVWLCWTKYPALKPCKPVCRRSSKSSGSWAIPQMMASRNKV